MEGGNFKIDILNQFSATLDRGNDTINFEPAPGVRGTFTFQYQIELVATRGTESFNLTSQPATVTVHVLPDTLVYYELYDDDTFGLYAGGGISLPDTLPGLHPTKRVTESGYGVISTVWDEALNPLPLYDTNAFLAWRNAVYLYPHTVQGAGNAATDFNLIPVTHPQPGGTVLGSIHPNFAGALYPPGTMNVTNGTFLIRTPQQMQNISAVAAIATGSAFNLTRNLDFAGVNLNNNGAVVTGTFDGTFNGNGFEIHNMTVNAPSGITPAGLFSQNGGMVRNVTLVNARVTGYGNVGGVAGSNLAGGIIEDVLFLSTNAHGDAPVTATGASGVAGGIAGQNDGTVRRALYIAPAPADGTHIFPIVGGGTAAVDSFFLHGLRYRIDAAGASGGVPGAWANALYNYTGIPDPTDAEIATFTTNGGIGLFTAEFTSSQIATGAAIGAWNQWNIDNTVHPYPVLITPATASAITAWPVADEGEQNHVAASFSLFDALLDHVYVKMEDDGDDGIDIKEDDEDESDGEEADGEKTNDEPDDDETDDEPDITQSSDSYGIEYNGYDIDLLSKEDYGDAD
jgi:hypothetical protein